MTDHLLTAANERWRTRLDDGCRSVAWSPGGRLFVIAADGSSLIDDPSQLTAPMAPDPVDAAWLGERRVAVVDTVGGVVFAGSGAIDAQPVDGARCVDSAQGRTIVGGANVVALFGDTNEDAPATTITTGAGQSHALCHTVGGMWAVGGSSGLVLIDGAMGEIDVRLEMDGVRAVAWADDAERLVAADLAGSLHLIGIHDPARGVELDGYPDPVRHLAISADGGLLVAAADDELTWWRIDDEGDPDDMPERAVVHEHPVTALAMSSDGLVTTGDAAGRIHVWSPWVTDHPVATMTLDSEIVASEWSSDGSRLAVASMCGELAVYDVTPGAVA